MRYISCEIYTFSYSYKSNHSYRNSRWNVSHSPFSQAQHSTSSTLILCQITFQATKLKTFPWSKLDAKLQEDGSLNASAATIGYPCNVERFWKYRDTWKKEFAFSDTIRQKNRQRMKKVLEQWRSRQGNVTREGGKEANPVVVGVHVRRTDYIKYLAMKTGGGAPPGLKYYRNAFEYYRKK